MDERNDTLANVAFSLSSTVQMKIVVTTMHTINMQPAAFALGDFFFFNNFGIGVIVAKRKQNDLLDPVIIKDTFQMSCQR